MKLDCSHDNCFPDTTCALGHVNRADCEHWAEKLDDESMRALVERAIDEANKRAEEAHRQWWESAKRACKVFRQCDEYERRAEEAEAKLKSIAEVLASNGCDCECGHHREEHVAECERCLACRIDDHLIR